MMSGAVPVSRHWTVPTTMNGNVGREKGYMFVSAMVVVVLMGISMAVLTKSWTYRVHRMKENELLFRGQQYSRAIRLYYQTHRRYPFKLEELMQVKPRVLRELYADPMTDDGSWGLVYLDDLQSGRTNKPATPGMPALRVVGVDGSPVAPVDPPVVPENLTDAQPEAEEDTGTTRVGQIVGVYSRSRRTAFRSFQKGKVYADWKFLGIINSSDTLKRMKMGSYNPALAKEAK